MQWFKDKWAAIVAKLKGWKTVAFNAVAALILIVALALDAFGDIDLSIMLDPKTVLVYTIVIKLVNIWLRTATDTAVGAKAAS